MTIGYSIFLGSMADLMWPEIKQAAENKVAAFFSRLANLDFAKTLSPQPDGLQPLGYWGDPAKYNVAEGWQFIVAYSRMTADAIERVGQKA